VARKQIEKTLNVMGVKGISAVNGRSMWEEMEKTAAYAQSVGQPVSKFISLVLTDIEMPEMDGYILTKKIKSDPRFQWHSGDHAFLAVRHVQSEAGPFGRRRRIRSQVRAAASFRNACPPPRCRRDAGSGCLNPQGSFHGSGRKQEPAR
jgi:CheY-like chemotaxis protein